MSKKKTWRRCPKCKKMGEVRTQIRLFELPPLQIMSCCGYQLPEPKETK